MKAFELRKSVKLILTIEDIAKQLSITRESARVTAVRYVRNGLLVRLKKDLYILSDNYKNLKEKDFFRIANLIQVPSYISLTTALSYYNISTQQMQNVVESIAVKRTKSLDINSIKFIYNLVKKEFYFGFERVNDFFIATPEKALADAIYLTALKRYNCDFEAIDFRKVNRKIISDILTRTNGYTIQFWKKLCKTYKI